MEYMFLPYRRYFEFSGRSRRKEYWLYILFYIVVLIVATILDNKLGLTIGGTEAVSYAEFGDGYASVGVNAPLGILSLIWLALNLIPSLAAAVRRMHDQDKSGWFILIPFYNLILLCMEGTRGPNRFGPDPKAGGDAQVFS
jgi:uncharacterized membrane protein YhaH (DUF805 family)